MTTPRLVTATLFVAALAPASPARAQTRGDNASAVQRLADTQEIQTLLLNYGRYLDARDFKAYSSLFARDGVWAGGMGTVQGPADIQALMEKSFRGPNTAHNFHLLSNFIIEVNGDTATAWSRWTFMAPGPNNTPVAAQAGRYEDTLVREDGHWRFKRRVASNDIPSGGPRSEK